MKTIKGVLVSPAKNTYPRMVFVVSSRLLQAGFSIWRKAATTTSRYISIQARIKNDHRYDWTTSWK